MDTRQGIRWSNVVSFLTLVALMMLLPIAAALVFGERAFIAVLFVLVVPCASMLAYTMHWRTTQDERLRMEALLSASKRKSADAAGAASDTATTNAADAAESHKESAMHIARKISENFENLLAVAISFIVVAYYWFTIWMELTIDLGINIRDVSAPPETYPLILFGLWAWSQRARANMISGGSIEGFWRKWENVEAAFMTGFFLVSLVWSLATKSNLSFVPSLVVFLFYAIYDWRDNVKRWSNFGKTGITELDLPKTINQEVEQNVKVVTRINRVIELPDGSFRPFDPTKLIDVTPKP